jgi:hypothetical protein
MRLFFASLLVLCAAILAHAHPGKTDQHGGHKCYKECAEWDLFYAEYHLHDKDGRPVKAVKKKPARSVTTTTNTGMVIVLEPKPQEPAATVPPVAQAAIIPDEPDLTLSWVLLALFLLLLVVRRNRKEGTAREDRASIRS